MTVSSFDTTYGQPIVKDGCGVFGILRKKDAPKISNLKVVAGISCIKYRGSNLGAGFASFSHSNEIGGNSPYRVKAFVRNKVVGEEVEHTLRNELEDHVLKELQIITPSEGSSMQKFSVLEYRVESSIDEIKLEAAVDKVNLSLLSKGRVNGRIFSSGRRVNVYKEVGYPREVAKMCGLDTEKELADLWIAHTRQPTNSPGTSPIWSHPFSSGECAIVHNGDISSFGANIEQLNSWGIHSHAGTDSEVIARLLDHLVRVEGLSMVEAATVLTNPFERNIASSSPRITELLTKYRGCRLDGPFAVVAGYSTEVDTYLLALMDRSKFRPLLIGEDESCYYVASEETQIRSLSKNATIWTPDPGSFFLASVEKGILSSATNRSISTQEDVLETELFKAKENCLEDFDATGKSSVEINEFIRNSYERGLDKVRIGNVSGQRYIGIGFSTKGRSSRAFRIVVEGFPGNCLSNLNDGGTFEVFGNVADDLADTMHSGSVIVHGNVRDVCAQALQGGSVFVRGCVGNRAGIQLREYGHKKPYLIVGETSDDYLGEYMAGGVIAVLGLSEDSKGRLVGNYLATGMVGGAIYIRGKTSESQVALLPHREEILNYLRAAEADGIISRLVLEKCMELEYPGERALSQLLPEDLFSRLRFLYFGGKYNKPVSVEYRKLSATDLGLLSEKLAEYFKLFGLPPQKLEEVLNSEFTIIKMREEKIETPIPPQEIPVEE